jgi:hypothetical protein
MRMQLVVAAAVVVVSTRTMTMANMQVSAIVYVEQV